MRTNRQIEIRRCRPLLGTFVKVTTSGSKAASLERGINAAFAAIEKVHRVMSFHDPDSDVSRMNREAFPKSVIVHPRGPGKCWKPRNILLKKATECSISRRLGFSQAAAIFPNASINLITPQHGVTFFSAKTAVSSSVDSWLSILAGSPKVSQSIVQ